MLISGMLMDWVSTIDPCLYRIVKLNFLHIFEDLKVDMPCIRESLFDSKNWLFLKTMKEACFGIHCVRNRRLTAALSTLHFSQMHYGRQMFEGKNLGEELSVWGGVKRIVFPFQSTLRLTRSLKQVLSPFKNNLYALSPLYVAIRVL